MDDINLTLEINLKNYTLNRIAEVLWETTTIQNEIKKFAVNVYSSEETISFNERKWRNITKKILNKSLLLPNQLSEELKNTVIFIGDRIFYWLIRVISELKLDAKYLNKIYWTPHGIIDNWKIYQNWLEDPKFPDLPDSGKSRMALFCLAATLADVNIIRWNLPEIARLLGRFIDLKIKDLSKFKVNTAISILLIYDIVRLSDVHFDDVYSELKSEEYPSGADKLFLHSMMVGHLRCAEYFYKRLKENDKERVVKEAALECLTSELFNVHMSVTERMPQIILYLLGKMSTERRKQFLVEKIADVYKIFLNTWPYEQLCAPLLDYVWADIPVLKKPSLLETNLTILMLFSKERQEVYKLTIHQGMLQNLLAKLPKTLKLRWFLKCDAIFELFKISDYSTINLILEDEDLKSSRSKLIDISHFMTIYFEEGGSSKNVKEYITQLKLSSEEQKNLLKFSKNSHVLKLLINYGHLDEAEEILKWQFNSNENKISEAKKELGKEFDPVEICYGYIAAGNFIWADKFLNFLYRDDDEVRKKVFSVEFIRDEFCTLWINNRKENLKAAKNKCAKFLKCCFKSDEELKKFKSAKLIEDENFISEIFEICENFAIDFDEIFEFCSVSPEKIDEIKRKIRNAIYWWLTSYGGNPKKFLILNSLINWICDSENLKKIWITKLVNSNKGGVLCFFFAKFIGRTDDVYREARKVFLLEWVKPYVDIDAMKYMIDEVKRTGGITEKDIQKTLDLLNLCKSNSVDLLIKTMDSQFYNNADSWLYKGDD